MNRPAQAEGVGILARVADEIQELADEASRVRRMSPLLALYRSSDWLEVVDAARTCLTEMEASIEQIGAVLTQKTADQLRRRIREDVRQTGPKLRLAVPGEEEEEWSVPDAGLPDGWEVPAGYTVNRRGVWKVDDDGAMARVSTHPIWPVGYLVDVDGDGHSLRVAWTVHGGGLNVRVIPHLTLMDARAVCSVGDGFPAGTHNARAVVKWIDTAAAANQAAMPPERCAARLGWMPGGFLLGAEWVGQAERAVVLAEDDAVRQIATALEPAGTWEGWLADALGPGSDSPDAWLGVYASVASVLVDRLNLAENPAIDWSGGTSQGKSTVQALAASVWGDPREGRLVMPWKVSPSGIEGRAAMLRHLPLILDDSKKARRREDVADVVYMHSGGSGAVRGKPGVGRQPVGSRMVSSWRSILISSGEQRLSSFTADAGARARVLCLVGSPFSSQEQSDAIKLGCTEHHGHLGRRVLVGVETGDAEQYRERYRELKEHYGAALRKSGAVAGRLGAVVALLDTARELAEAVGLPAPPKGLSPINRAWLAAVAGGEDADQPAEALRDLYGYAVAHPTSFWGRHESDPKTEEPRVPHSGWLGAWARGDGWTHIDVMPTTVRDLLVRGGFDSGTIDRWHERGWLVEHNGCGYRADVRIDGARTRVYRLSRAAIDEVM